MTRDFGKEIKEIIDVLKCSKGYKCYKSGFSNLCKAKDIGKEHYLVCLEKSDEKCKFKYPYYDIKYCVCPLRIYIIKELKK